MFTQKNLNYNADKLILGNDFLPAGTGTIDICTSNPSVNKITINGIVPTAGGGGGTTDPLFLMQHLGVGYSADPAPTTSEYVTVLNDRVIVNNPITGLERLAELHPEHLTLENLNSQTAIKNKLTCDDSVLTTITSQNTSTAEKILLEEINNPTITTTITSNSIILGSDVLSGAYIDVGTNLASKSTLTNDGLIFHGGTADIQIGSGGNELLINRTVLNYNDPLSVVTIGAQGAPFISTITPSSSVIAEPTAYTSRDTTEIVAEKTQTNQKITMSADDITIFTANNPSISSTSYSLYAAFLRNETTYELDRTIVGIGAGALRLLFDLTSDVWTSKIQGITSLAPPALLPPDISLRYDCTVTFADTWLPTGATGVTVDRNYKNLRFSFPITRANSTNPLTNHVTTLIDKNIIYDDVEPTLGASLFPPNGSIDNYPQLQRVQFSQGTGPAGVAYKILFPDIISFLPTLANVGTEINPIKVTLKRANTDFRY